MLVPALYFLANHSIMSVPASHFLRPSVYSTALYFLRLSTLCPLPLSSIQLSFPSTTLCPYMALLCLLYCLMSLYGLLYPLWPSVPLRPSVSFIALCLFNAFFPLYGPLSPLLPSVPSTAFCPLYGTLGPSTALCPIFGPLFPLWPSVPLPPSVSSTTCCPLYGPLPLLRPLSPLLPSVPYMTLWPIYGPLSPLRRSVFSTALYPLYDPLFSLRPSVPLSPPHSPYLLHKPQWPDSGQRISDLWGEVGSVGKGGHLVDLSYMVYKA
jgi:hypothetical protein